MNGWKYRSKGLLKLFFVTKKVIKKQTGSVWNFLQLPIPVCRGANTPYFKINAPIFCCPLFSENYLNTQVRINKRLNKHNVDYHPSLSQLRSRIHPVIFVWPLKGFTFLESFLNFFLNLSTMVSNQIYGVQITGKYICQSKNWICLFLFVPPSKTLPRFLSLTSRKMKLSIRAE